MRNEGQDCDYAKQKIKHYTESNRWVNNECGTKDNIVTTTNRPIYCFRYSVLSSVCRSHNIVLRSAFIILPSITFCVVFYLLFVVVTILSFVPHSLLLHRKKVIDGRVMNEERRTRLWLRQTEDKTLHRMKDKIVTTANRR
jgi:hypothetical protein